MTATITTVALLKTAKAFMNAPDPYRDDIALGVLLQYQHRASYSKSGVVFIKAGAEFLCVNDNRHENTGRFSYSKSPGSIHVDERTALLWVIEHKDTIEPWRGFTPYEGKEPCK